MKSPELPLRPVLRPVRRRPASGGRILLLVLGLLAVVVFLRQGSLPQTGTASPGLARVPVERNPVRLSPQGPQKGADPVGIVRGFLQAGVGSGDDYAVARSYLTPAAGQIWAPTGQALIYPDDRSITLQITGVGARREVLLQTSGWASLGSYGELSLVEPSERFEQRLTLVLEDKKWRIADLDDRFALWLPKYEFDRSYAPVQLMYISAETQTLVPSLHWFNRSGPGIVTAVTKALLAGPPNYLAAAVVSGFPAQTELAVGSVPTKAGVASIDLTSIALSTTSQQRRQIWAQTEATLRQLSQIRAVDLQVDGLKLAVPDYSGALTAEGLGFSPCQCSAQSPLFNVAGRLARLAVSADELDYSASQVISVAALTQYQEVQNVRDSPNLIGLDQKSQRITLVRPAGPTRELLTGGTLLRPAVDPQGWVWSADLAKPGKLLLSSLSGETNSGPIQLSPSWLADRRVRTLAISGDGTRVAVGSVAADGKHRIDLAGIGRSAKKVPDQIEIREIIGQNLSQVIDLTWVDDNSIAALGVTTDGKTAVVKLGLGGASQPTAALDVAEFGVDPPVQLLATDRQFFVRTLAGRVWLQSGSQWRLLDTVTSMGAGS